MALSKEEDGAEQEDCRYYAEEERKMKIEEKNPGGRFGECNYAVVSDY